MSEIVYRICTLLEQVLIGVPVGTNLGLFYLLFALLSGRFLPARGAVFAALTDFGLPEDAVRRVEAALCYGKGKPQALLTNWQALVLGEGYFAQNTYEGVRPVACDLTGFLRPQLQKHPGKHYVAQAGKAVPAIVIGIAAGVGHLGKTRLALPRLLVRWEASDTSENDLQKRLLTQAAETLATAEALVTDAGFDLTDLLELRCPFVLRLSKNATARRNFLPDYKGKGRRPEYGEIVRPLPRTYNENAIVATAPDATEEWTEGGRLLRAEIWYNLVASDARPDTAAFRVIAIHDPRYKEPLLLEVI